MVFLVRKMGCIISRFRLPFFNTENPEVYKKQLEKITEEILVTEEKKTNLQYQYSIIIEFIVTYSKLLYIMVACVFFFSTLPSSIFEYVLICGPLIIFHVLVNTLKMALKWYFDHEIQQKIEKAKNLRYKKKIILSKVKETTRFNDAKQIIEEFSYDKSYISNLKGKVDNAVFSGVVRTKENIQTFLNNALSYILGEEKENALICLFCQRHNGLALENEFEYMGFRCCQCFNYNPPRRQRLIANHICAPTRNSLSTSAEM